MKLSHTTLFLIAIVASACESLITDIPADKLPRTESKLVIQSFISPQATSINVVVTESVPLFSETTSKGGVVRNALVKISDGTSEVTIPYDTASALYSIDSAVFPIKASKTYSLFVSDGSRVATAMCTVPAKQVLASSFKIDTSFSRNLFEQDTSLTLQMTWTDIAADTNYYRVKASVDLEYSVAEGNSAATFKEVRTKGRFAFNWDETIGRNDYQSDGNLDGAPLTSPIGRTILPNVIAYDFGSGNSFTVYPKAKIALLIMEVYNTDVHYFKYHRSLEMRGNSDNPFIEPTLIYTNVSGGLGCFAAYNIGQLNYRPN
ncbi:DUF4249 domain-containing protein [Dyadobacter sp. CY326]|uniref:DUF4249 domain-containing protein n=1 Tax=Dyadobacter sp. CY326 TaxID=2907300 RepID=UPI001F28C5F2|nr:DUF4249 domain-containing protein [Dyadobacter sp. CY326]MCE7065511.1 DUF4249 domain-containing protein [Dyadobacter sp. CY326]